MAEDAVGNDVDIEDVDHFDHVHHVNHVHRVHHVHQEKNTIPMKKLELNRAYQLREKSKKPPKISLFKKNVFSGGFLDFSLNWWALIFFIGFAFFSW